MRFLLFYHDLPPLMRPDLKTTPPVKRGDLVSLEAFGEDIARVLWARGIAVPIDIPNEIKPVKHLHGKMAKMKAKSKTKQASLMRWFR